MEDCNCDQVLAYKELLEGICKDFKTLVKSKIIDGDVLYANPKDYNNITDKLNKFMVMESR